MSEEKNNVQTHLVIDLAHRYKGRICTIRIPTSQLYNNPSLFIERIKAAESLTTFGTKVNALGQVVIDPDAQEVAFLDARWREPERFS